MSDQEYRAESAQRQGSHSVECDPKCDSEGRGFRHIWDVARPDYERAVAKIIGGEK